MRENTRDWQRWRVTVAVAAPTPPVARYTRPILNTAAAEQPGPDGIRHELVARVRQAIAAGTYDTDEKWLAAEERLCARADAGR